MVMDCEDKIEQLDPSLFVLPSQTTLEDRTSLLRLQRFLRQRIDSYCYLEVGSHLGGSLLPHLADSRCIWAVSIDPRPQGQPDERGRLFYYDANSTARMIDNIREHLSDAHLSKLQTFDKDAVAVLMSDIQHKADLALIDGEHTNVATFSDFVSIFPMLAEDAVIAFHDAHIITAAIQNAERFLTYSGIRFRTVFLPDNVAAIGLRRLAEPLIASVGDAALDRDKFVADASRRLQSAVAMEVLARDERDLPFRTVAAYFSWRVVNEVAFRASRLYRRLWRSR